MPNGLVPVHQETHVLKITMAHQCAPNSNVKLKLHILNHTWLMDHSKLSSLSIHMGKLTKISKIDTFLIFNMKIPI